MKTLAQELREENDRLVMRMRWLHLKDRTLTMAEAHTLCQQRDEELKKLGER
jgi:hypothetical protein